MRLFLAAIILLFLAVGLIYDNCAKHGGDEAHIEQAQSANTVIAGAIHEPYAATEHASSYDASKDRLYRVYLAVAIFGVFVALGGIRVLYRQTKATEQAANAAKSSADCLKAIERPWLLVRTVNVTSVDLAGGTKAIAIEWDIKNFGKVPGLASEIVTNVDVLPASYQFPAEPIYKNPHAIIFKNPVVPPGRKSHPIISAMNRGWGINEQENVVTGSLIFWVSGKICYASPWGDKYETRFSLKIDDIQTGKNSPIGPECYNKIT